MRSIRLRSLIGVTAAVLLCGVLASCKDTKETDTPPGSPGAPGKAVNNAATGAFEKPRKPDGSVKLKFITNGASPFWSAAFKGVDEMKDELKCDASYGSPDPADNNTQRQLFEDAVASGVDGIAVSPIQSDAFKDVINGAVDKGIPVLCYDSDSEKSKRLVYIGTNNYEAGKKAGEEAVKMFPNGGKLVAFVGNLSAQNARDRYQGFKDAVKGKNIEFLQEPFEDDKDMGRLERNVTDAISKYGTQINGMVGFYSYNPPVMIKQVVTNNLRDKIKLIAFDGDPQTLKALEAGTVDVSIIQKPYQFGRLTMKLLYLINRKGYKAAMDEMKGDFEKLGMKVDGNVIDTGVEVVTPANAAPFLQKLKEMKIEST